MGLRDVKASARRLLHQAMKVGAFYIPDPEADPLPDPIACTVRVHTRQDALGNLQGTSLDYAERHETIPRIIFLGEEIADQQQNGGVVTITDPATLAKEAYKIDNWFPPDGITITAEVSVIAPEDYGELPFPSV